MAGVANPLPRNRANVKTGQRKGRRIYNFNQQQKRYGLQLSDIKLSVIPNCSDSPTIGALKICNLYVTMNTSSNI